jgi:hypothetical protein
MKWVLRPLIGSSASLGLAVMAAMGAAAASEQPEGRSRRTLLAVFAHPDGETMVDRNSPPRRWRS